MILENDVSTHSAEELEQGGAHMTELKAQPHHHSHALNVQNVRK